MAITPRKARIHQDLESISFIAAISFTTPGKRLDAGTSPSGVSRHAMRNCHASRPE
jgi:hypothetical protein